MFAQLGYLMYEVNQHVNGRWWRWLTVWFGGSVGVTVSYRLDRALFLLFGRSYALVRLLFLPCFFLLRMMSSKHEIHYKAEIGPGLKVLHSSLGVVVSGYAVCGRNLVLTGGNCLGGRKPLQSGDLLLGDNIELGANAVILGPVHIKSNCKIGAGAVVIHDAEEDSILVGVPARPVRSADETLLLNE